MQCDIDNINLNLEKVNLLTVKKLLIDWYDLLCEFWHEILLNQVKSGKKKYLWTIKKNAICSSLKNLGCRS